MNEFNYAQPFIVVGAFIVRDGKILLIKENHEPDKGTWNLPAGKLDMGENPIDAAAREAYEESGLTFTPTAILGIHSVFRPHVESSKSSQLTVLRIVFAGNVSGEVSLEHGDPEDGVEEIAEYRWFTPAEILTLDNAELRYHDIKNYVKDYLDGISYPLELITHFVQN